MDDSELQSRIAPVLGRVPSGVYILVAGDGAGRKTGLLTSWVQQASFEPPQVTIAVNMSRYLIDWLKDGSPVTLNQVAKGDNTLFRHFGKGFDADANAFEGIDLIPANNGLVALSSAMATLEGTVCGQMDAGDHRILLVTITNAISRKDPSQFEPFVHVRKNGFSY
jgi:flavin reductase (DIM6/NTAB) family NADH-FMN oxidoreductase RutF